MAKQGKKDLKEVDRIRMAQFRQNLKDLRKSKGWTQHILSTHCDVHRSKISALEANENENLTLPTLFELARGLNVHPKQLIDYDFDFIKNIT